MMGLYGYPYATENGKDCNQRTARVMTVRRQYSLSHNRNGFRAYRAWGWEFGTSKHHSSKALKLKASLLELTVGPLIPS